MKYIYSFLIIVNSEHINLHIYSDSVKFCKPTQRLCKFILLFYGSKVYLCYKWWILRRTRKKFSVILSSKFLVMKQFFRDKLKIISYVLSMFWALSTTRSNAKHGKIKAQDFVNYLWGESFSINQWHYILTASFHGQCMLTFF